MIVLERMKRSIPIKRPPAPELPERNTAIYNAIRWWGRKPWSIVRKYIETYTNKEEVVFDPFAGCGVVAIESLKTGRKTIYNDLNPLAYFIARTSSIPIDATELETAFKLLVNNLETKEFQVTKKGKAQLIKFSWLYSKRCPKCKSEGTIKEIVWSNVYEPSPKPENIERLRQDENKLAALALKLLKILQKYGQMRHDDVLSKLRKKADTAPEMFLRAFERLAELDLVVIKEMPILRVYECNCEKTNNVLDKDDLNKIQEIESMEPSFYYPKQELRYATGERFFKQRRVWSVDKLFTKRNLIALSILKNEIKELEVSKIAKDYLLLCFAAILEHVSKMERPNKKGWGVETYWISPVFLEQNVWHVFKNRFKTIKKAAEECGKEIGDFINEANSVEEVVRSNATAFFLKEDARKLPLSEGVAKYVFTDPPYGDTIQYLELSFMQSSWLGFSSPFDKEIIVNPKQGKSAEIYRDMLTQAFTEVFRVLDYDSYMTVTFHSAEIKYWNALIYAIQIAGFEYVVALYQPPSKEYTDFIHTRDPGRMSGDIYVTFFKPKPEKRGKKEPGTISVADVIQHIVLPEARKIVVEHGGSASYDQLVRGVTLFLLNKGLLHNPQIRDLGFESVFDKYLKRIGRSKIWGLKEGEKISPIDFIPLDKRIEWIIQSVFNNKNGKARPDEILAAIYTNLKNSKTPESKEIFDVVRETAESEQINSNIYWVVKGKKLTEFMDTSVTEAKPSEKEMTDSFLNHDRMIKVLAELGQHMKYDVWIGEKEQNQNPELKKFCTISDLEISGIDPVALSRLREVDVVWLMRKTVPVALLEVEHTTNIRSGIERTSNVFKALPHLSVKVVIVVPDGRVKHFRNVMNEPTFKTLTEGHEVYNATYSTVTATHDEIEHEYSFTMESWIREACKKI